MEWISLSVDTEKRSIARQNSVSLSTLVFRLLNVVVAVAMSKVVSLLQYSDVMKHCGAIECYAVVLVYYCC